MVQRDGSSTTPRDASLTETVTEQKTTILKPTLTLKTSIFQQPTETRLHTPKRKQHNHTKFRHPVEGYFSSKFQVICNRCVVMAAWIRKSWKFVRQFLRFFGKTTPYVKISKIIFQKFLPIEDVLLKFRKMLPTGNEWNRASFTWPKKNKISAAFQIVASARIAPKICLSQPPTMYSHCFRFHLNPFTFGGVIAERMNTVFCPVQYFHYSPEAKRNFGRIISAEVPKHTVSIFSNSSVNSIGAASLRWVWEEAWPSHL